jgi:hypothetical protein
MNTAGTDKDYSKADIGWCITTIRRGFSMEETAAMLLEVKRTRAPPQQREAIRRADRQQGGAVYCRAQPAAPKDETRSWLGAWPGQ